MVDHLPPGRHFQRTAEAQKHPVGKFHVFAHGISSEDLELFIKRHGGENIPPKGH
ncbi:hypothetical protein SDC9_145220 [bioreactor metagenome]|uniref:Uncharacterized protein n=1 Tax=bioreactor metagenome TaxID=1076179 RepID=A0A645E9F5_9ZZZZ